MFRNNFVVSIKSNGKFFKENKDSINIPFDSEYSIYLKNLESRDAVVTISVDGKDVLDGNRLIVRAGSVLELEGFMTDQAARNKFKFIERTKEIDDFRGVTPEDGIISVTFDFEKKHSAYYPYTIYYPNPYYYADSPWTLTTYGSTDGTYTVSNVQVSDVTTIQNGIGLSSSAVFLNSQVSDGISVPGNDISQNFGIGFTGNLENSPTTISFKLFGIRSGEQKQVIYSRDKIKCPTCGLENGNNNSYCGRCGARLINK